jgi:hypothetical protein
MNINLSKEDTRKGKVWLQEDVAGKQARNFRIGKFGRDYD